MQNAPAIFVGCAGWSLSKTEQQCFDATGSHLVRYASRFSAVEINSSFYRPHRRATYERWASSVPAAFRFSVKVPKTITHEHRLLDAGPPLDTFLGEVAGLGEKLGVLLLQLPPRLACDAAVAGEFLEMLQSRVAAVVAIEARHETWFTADVESLLRRHRVVRVAADPPRAAVDAEPGGWSGMVYHRLHGSPRTYFSSYDDDSLARRAVQLTEAARAGATAWCMFDNTAGAAAVPNALRLLELLDERR